MVIVIWFRTPWSLTTAPCTAADTNLLKLPESDPDEKWLYLSDILPTAWHANVLAETGDGKTVAIWGAGPGEKLEAVCDMPAWTLPLCAQRSTLLFDDGQHAC